MYSINKEHNGIELYFTDKPPQSVIDILKANRWRWHNVKKCWYNRNTPDNLKLAESVTNGEAQEEAPKAEASGNEYGVKVGEIFYSSWGYDQTNINFFQVIGLRGKKSVILREVSLSIKEQDPVSGMSQDVSFHLTSELLPPRSYSTFLSGDEKGDLKRIAGEKDHYYINLSSFANAYPYHGEKLYNSWYA